MRATIFHGPYDVRVEDVPDPVIALPTDAVVQVTAACVCGSDLWPYRGTNPRQAGRRIGHEAVGVVLETGSDVRDIRVGDFVIVPFMYSDNTCVHCLAGMQTSCVNGDSYGKPDKAGFMVDGCQGELLRVPYADGTLVATPGRPDPDQVPSLLALSDVMGTGWHAAASAGVAEGDTVVVVGDGAVGLCAVLAASRMGAERVIAMSGHEPRQRVARRLGATDVIAERGRAAEAAVAELTDGVGADAVLECVGTEMSLSTALAVARPGGMVAFVGMPHVSELPVASMFGRNVGLVGGVAPVRAYLPRLLDDVLAGVLDPGIVFDLEVPLEDVAEGYAAMDERRAIKSLVRP